jgi:hypothetical protein
MMRTKSTSQELSHRPNIRWLYSRGGARPFHGLVRMYRHHTDVEQDEL